MTGLFVSFLVTALLYATIGFGGGSTYNALLALAEVDYRVLPSIALTCNMIVVAGGAWRFYRAGHVNWPVLVPFLLTSTPMALVGGSLHLSAELFLGLLGFSLLLTGARMMFRGSHAETEPHPPAPGRLLALALPLGAVLGLLAGMVGIGGGVFLAPLLHWLGWMSQRAISASCTLFILINSAAGLAGQFTKMHAVPMLELYRPYMWLFLAVLLGGQVGSHLGVHVLGAKTLRRLTGVLVFYVSLRLLYRWASLVAA